MAIVKEYKVLISASPFSCPVCNHQLEYVQVLVDDENRILEDYFQCKACFTHIQNEQMEEDLPGFCD
jgi:transcription elongation factor Elf1